MNFMGIYIDLAAILENALYWKSAGVGIVYPRFFVISHGVLLKFEE